MDQVEMFPIGKYEFRDSFSIDEVKQSIDRLRSFPDRLVAVVGSLTIDQLETKTKPGKWTIAQVVNHIADSHMNMIVRVKLALTEDTPVIKPYDETAWANLSDGNATDIRDSLNIITSVHTKLANLLGTTAEADLHKGYYHPADQLNYPVGEVVRMYVWHGDHHLAFIEEVL